MSCPRTVFVKLFETQIPATIHAMNTTQTGVLYSGTDRHAADQARRDAVDALKADGTFGILYGVRCRRVDDEWRVTVENTKPAASGRITSLMEYQQKHGDTLLTLADGSPKLGVRVALDNGAVLWIETPRAIQAITRAVQASGASDLEIDGHLAVRAFQGRVRAVYDPPMPVSV